MATTLRRTRTTPTAPTTEVRTGVLRRWHRLRGLLALGSIAIGVACAVVFDWPEMAYAAGITLLVAVDAHFALRTQRTSVIPTLLFDITLTGVVLAIVEVPPIGAGSTTAYFIVLVAVLGRNASWWPIGAYAVAVGATAPFVRPFLGVDPPPTYLAVIAAAATVAVFSSAMLLVITKFATLIRERIGEEERRVRVADSVSEASRALVAQDDPKALHIAVEAIRRALGASVAFVEQNIEDPDGGVSAVVVESAHIGAQVHPTYERGARTPWASLPGAKLHLGGGAPFFFRIEESEGTDHDRHGLGGVRSEVDVPVIINGTWVGVVGVGDRHAERRWGSEDLMLLRTLADLTAAFWQRIEDLRVRDSLIGSLDGRLRYEEALARSSKSLLGGSGLGVDDALESAGIAAKVDEVFITRTVHGDDGEVLADSIASWVQPGLTPDLPVGSSRSYADMPAVVDAVHNGAIARINDGDTVELVVGIEVGGGWFGTVGFLRHHSAEVWTKRDAAFLRTIGDILGAFYERAETRHHLETLLQSKDQLIATVSHELRTPLTAVVGLAEELGAADSRINADEREQLLGLIAHESREMADLIEDLLIAARSEEGLVPVFPERTDLSLLATSVANRLSVPEDVTLDIADVESPAYADPVRVRQIIRNLLTNAIRYGGRAITVTAGGGDGVSFIEVHDDGAGIPEADRQRIFEPYGRSEASGVVAGSVGLGLALSKRLAELLSGTLEYRPGPGCTFRLTVPDHAPESVEA